jgi:hypothetical protein
VSHPKAPVCVPSPYNRAKPLHPFPTMTHLETQLLEKLRTLPTDKQHEVLDFIEFLIAKTPASPSTPTSTPAAVSFAHAAQQYIGIAEGPGDLSTNSNYMEGYGA